MAGHRPNIRDRVIGQYRHEKKRAAESPDMQDRVLSHRPAMPLFPPMRRQPGLSVMVTCVGCGRTKDLWEGNNGEGISKRGGRYCCKPCADGDRCTCTEIDQHKGQELNSLWRSAVKPRRRKRKQS